MNRSRRTRLAVAGSTALLLTAGYAATVVVNPFKKTGPLTADEIRTTSQHFLDSWAAGEVAAAAALTDDAPAASDAMTDYRDELQPAMSVEVTPGDTATVPFSVTARLRHGEAAAVWTYDSSLRVVRDEQTGEPRVAWSSGVLHPRLANGGALEAVEPDGLRVELTDRDGRALTVEEFPSLATIVSDFGKRYGAKLGGSPGVEVRITGSEGRTATPLHVSRGEPAVVHTTLSASVQRAAERAVKKYPQSSAVAVEPSSGEILAVANNRADGFNAALLGRRAPGSTLKIVTAAALLEERLVSPSKPAPCPKYVRYEGAVFHNLNEFEIHGSTFSDAFIRSCNTTFIEHADDIAADTLATEAQEVFGLGLEWRSGVATFDGSVPVAEGPEKAATMIGQGRVQLNALNLASIAATTVAGRFRQPVLVSPDLDGRTIAQARRRLPEDTAEQLRALMRRTATEGTATKAMRGLQGDVGAKTGSAEVDGAETSDSWFTGFRNDTAAAAVVEAGGHGGDAAGPVVREILAAGD